MANHLKITFYVYQRGKKCKITLTKANIFYLENSYTSQYYFKMRDGKYCLSGILVKSWTLSDTHETMYIHRWAKNCHFKVFSNFMAHMFSKRAPLLPQ